MALDLPDPVANQANSTPWKGVKTATDMIALRNLKKAPAGKGDTGGNFNIPDPPDHSDVQGAGCTGTTP